MTISSITRCMHYWKGNGRNMKIPWQFVLFFALAWLVVMLIASYLIVGRVVFGPTIVGLVIFVGGWYVMLKWYATRKK